MKQTFTKKVKEEISKHIEKNRQVELTKMTSDVVALKKDLRIRFFKHGIIYNPDKEYHLEFSFNEHNTANFTIKELSYFDILARLSVNNQNRYIVYIVDENTILKVLKLLGANDTYKEYKKIAEYKKKVKATRAKVNFETANIKKAVKSGLAQVDDINLLLQKKKIKYLDSGLQQVIKTRLKYPTITMTELAEKIGNISKSALNHRFIKIRKMVKEL